MNRQSLNCVVFTWLSVKRLNQRLCYRKKPVEQAKPPPHEVTATQEAETVTNEEEEVAVENEVDVEEGAGEIEHEVEEAVHADTSATTRSRSHSRGRSRPTSTGDPSLIVPRGKKEVINITGPLDFKEIMSDIDLPTVEGWSKVGDTPPMFVAIMYGSKADAASLLKRRRLDQMLAPSFGWAFRRIQRQQRKTLTSAQAVLSPKTHPEKL
eukprot:2692983-Pyramimonas_sp.AAC.1